MEHGFSKRANKMFETRRKRKVKNRVVIGAGSLVLLLTFQIMMLPALTLTDKILVCGLEEHVHSEECNETILVCQEGSKEGHSHSDHCFQTSYICGEEAAAGHIHTDACYCVSCDQEETEGHAHSESCYGIACGEEASVGHSHDETCRDENGELICGKTEKEGHVHNDSCQGLICGKEESVPHTHTDACKQMVLVCELEETEGHIHSDACMGEPALICGLEETEAVESDHIHGTECYQTYRACEMEEHTHTDACYQVVDGEEVPGEELLVEIPDYIYDDVLGMNHSPLSLEDGNSEPADYSNLIIAEKVAKAESGYALTLEAFAQGELDSVTVEKPLDVVMLLDQSAAMYEPAMPGAADVELNAEMTGEELEEAVVEAGLITREIFEELVAAEDFVSERAMLRGYFLGRSIDDAWYLIQYDAEEDVWLLWEREASEAVEEDGNDGENAEDPEETATAYSVERFESIPEEIDRFYVSRYGKVYDAVIALADSLSESDVEHRMALVGMEENAAALLGENEEELPALIHLGEEYERFFNGIDHMQAGQNSASLSAGFEVANSIFEEVDEENAERQRAVILITSDETEISEEELTAAVNASYETKNTCGAKVYAVVMEDCENDFRQYLTSAYPMAMVEIPEEEAEEPQEDAKAEESAEEGDEIPAEEGEEEAENQEEVEDSGELEILNITEEDLNDEFEYRVVLENACELYESLEAVAADAVSGTADVDDTAVMRAVLSEYFALADQESIKVYVAPYLGGGAFGEAQESDEITVELSMEGETEEQRMNIVEVSGFNFANELLGEPVAAAADEAAVDEASEETMEEAAKGHKLIVEIPLMVRDGFWGGNGVPVLDEESGVYAGGLRNIRAVESPETDVELSLAITEDAVVYLPYLQDVDMAKLVDVVSRGKLVSYDGTEFVPQEDWMDDFAMIQWVYHPESISNEESSAGHQFMVGMLPRNIQLMMADAESGSAGVTAETTVDVRVVKPLITFNDIVISLGQKPDDEGLFYQTHNAANAEVLWVYENAGESEAALTDDTQESAEEDSGAKQQPDVTIVDVQNLGLKLKFEYMPMGPEEDQFIFDTPINVAVYQVNHDGSKTNITEHVYFQQADCALEMHTEEKETFAMHTGNLADAAEFMVHVQSGIELPNTGGIGTTVFYVLGGVLLVGALILLVTKKRMNKNEKEDLDVILDDTDDL